VERTQAITSKGEAENRALSFKRKTNAMTGKGKNGSGSLQIAKVAIYLPAIAVNAAGAHMYQKQAKSRLLPHLVVC